MTEMTIEALEARASEIDGIEFDGKSADELKQLADERDAINAELETRKAVAAEEAEKRQKIADGVEPVNVIEKFNEKRKNEMDINSVEYRNALLTTMLGRELDEETRAAFVHTTSNTGNVLPKTMVDRIWSLIEQEHAIVGDITLYRTNTIMELVKHTAIAQGDATNVNENAANSDEQNTFAKVTLNGKDFSKHIDLSYAMAAMSIDAFEDYLVNEIKDRIASALASEVVTQIYSDYTSDSQALTSGSVGKYEWADIAGAFAALKDAKNPVVYCTRATLYGKLAAMVDTTKRPIFQPNAQNGIEGYLLGAPVKIEDAVADDVLLIGDPSRVVGNVVQDIMVETDKDIKKHVYTYSGYCRFECALLYPKAFVKLSVQQAQGGT